MSCCHGPEREGAATSATTPATVAGTETGPANGAAPAVSPAAQDRVIEQVSLPGGSFLMGDAFDEGYPEDGEGPVHEVALSPFTVDTTAVTNAEFQRFVAATGYRTESEVYGYSGVFHLLIAADAADILGRPESLQWWVTVRGADWAHPHGPKSSWQDVPDHPVVQVSWNDAVAYCRWAGRALPTEAQWEYAARGGLAQARYPWGNELVEPGGTHRCNIWQGIFPTDNTLDDGFLGPAPVRSFPPNGFGLYETSGNVWEWCADWFLPKYYRKSPADNPPGPTIGQGRVMRGGSFLCHDSYCNRYRVAARSKNTPDSAASNIGFRTVAV